MAKFSHDNNMDVLLNRIKNNAALVVLCQGQPAGASEALQDLGTSSGKALGESSIGSSSFTGPAAGDTSGRKLTFNQLSGLDIDVTSTGADHVALVASTANGSTLTELLVVTTLTAQPVTQGNTATINAFDYEVRDPS